MKKHNFSAGPCILPQEVLQKAAAAVLNFNDDDLSLIEISHRSKSFVAVMEKARSLALELLGLENKGYQALFLHGGASLEFLMVAYNLSGDGISKISKGDRLFTRVKPPNKAGAKLSACSHLLAKASPFIANWVSSVLL